MSKIKDVDTWFEKLESRLSDDWKQILIGSKKRIRLLKEALSEILPDIEKLRPEPKNIFAFTKYIKVENIRAVILGQDPYPNKHACGLCFSSEQRSEPLSWLPIKKALQAQELLSKEHDRADLRAWEYQGVLLINTSLTTIDGEPKQHSAHWEVYVNCILEHLIGSLEAREPARTTCWLLWGEDAKAKASLIKAESKGSQKILKWCHPSPQVAYNKDPNDPKNFIHCSHFTKVAKISGSEWDMSVRWNAISEDIECFSDGSTEPNKLCKEAESGYAAVFTRGPLAGLTIAGHVDNTKTWTTNIRAEGQALISIFETLANLPDIWEKATVYLDCKFYIDLLTKYIPSWMSSGVSLDDRKNSDINEHLWKMYKEFKKDDKTVILKHVYSHKKEPETGTHEHYEWEYNDFVDRAAEHARLHFPVGFEKRSFSFRRDYL